MTDQEDFALDSVDAQDEATLVIKHPVTNAATNWQWTFYGPGHPKTIELSGKATRGILQEQAANKQAQLNGKKIKVDVQSADELLNEMVDSIVARTKTFTPIKTTAGDTIEFSSEAAKKFLLDPRKGWLFSQITDWLKAVESFIQPSAKS